MPWLMDSVEAELNRATVCRHILDAAIRDVVRTRAEEHSKLEAAELTRSAEADVPAQPQPVTDVTTASAADDDDEQQASTAINHSIYNA